VVPLARRNLLDERSRFAMAVGGVAFAVVLVIVILSLYRGWSDVGRLYEQLPGQIWISQSATSDPFHSTSFLPASAVARARAVDGVRGAVAVDVRHVAVRAGRREHDVFVLAIDLPAARLRASGVRLAGPGTIDVDRVLADDLGVGVGGSVRILGRALRVTGVHRGGNSIFETAFMDHDDARALFALPGYVSFVLADAAPGTAPEAVAHRLVAAVPGSEAHSAREFAESFADRVSAGFLAVVGVLVGIGFVVGGAVVALTTYTSTIEKAPEFAVLKALGAPGALLYRVVVTQSLIVAAAGSVTGVAVAALAVSVIEDAVPQFVTEMRVADVLVVAAAALATGVLASLVPTIRLDRIEPAEVFRA
jgi:putative ABC transport system permease protein